MKKRKLPRDRRSILPYQDFLKRVNCQNWSAQSDDILIEELHICQKNDLPKMFSLLKEVIFRCKGFRLFDTQLAAAYSMLQGRIAELPTGEGKTLAAVVAAVCFALGGKQVHILVFNDYLSKRDYIDNLSIFTYCQLSAGYISARSSAGQRKEAYHCDILYIPAKEAGFDYLKEFLASEQAALMGQRFQVAIVDEADSIMIDEARIPLVIAGEAEADCDHRIEIDQLVQSLEPSHIEMNLEERQIWLTETGISYIEEQMNFVNLFDLQNTESLSLIYNALEAHHFYQKDKDYLIKEGSLKVIDEATGRIAKNRKFPDLLHEAIETKEKLKSSRPTMIRNMMPMQFFLLKYEKLCGMTGTVVTAKREIKSMYGLDCDIIPPHVVSRRMDHEDCIYKTDADLQRAVIDRVFRAYGKGQPVLLGTRSVEESEQYAMLLEAVKLPCVILNARNDETEAELVSHAGEPGRITVSTNMAGRGIDIKLGYDAESRRTVMEAGGLLVISTGLNRSLRIDNQLRGRAGRQGDPGETQFLISLEQPLLQRSLKKRPKKLEKEIRLIQRIEEGRDAEARYTLERYAFVIEEQRRRIAAFHSEVLLGSKDPALFKKEEPILYNVFAGKVGEQGVIRAERQLTLYFINQHWSDYLGAMDDLREGIHLSIIGREDPLEVYQRAAVKAFSDMEGEIQKDILYHMKTCTITEEGVDLSASGLAGATTTWTYMIDESKSQFTRLPHLMRGISNVVKGTLLSRKPHGK